ncbi:MAG: hypothetical protein AAF226_10805 [Verrucomicrobiota bacterium]
MTIRWPKLQRVKSLLYPPICEDCGDPFYDGDSPCLCSRCEADVQLNAAPYCQVCGEAYAGFLPTDFECSNCGDRTIHFDFAIGAIQSGQKSMELMHRYKYLGQMRLSKYFGYQMQRVWQDKRLLGKPWNIIPVPLHMARRRERGFNQTDEIAREFLRQSPPEIRKDLRLIRPLKRSRKTVRQASLDRKDRLENLAEAFEIRSRGLRKAQKSGYFMIIDDVLTTGATGSECASVLRKALEVKEIAVISALRG